jgi:uncharacterized protein (TIGR03083 family)
MIYERVAVVVSGRRLHAPDRTELAPAPEGEALVGWFAEQRSAMLAALEATDDDIRVWNWSGDSPGPVSFWDRRMTHETLIHRVDAELAEDCQPAPAMPEVAADTIGEFFDLFFPRFKAKLIEAGAEDVMHLQATDVQGAEWTFDARSGAAKMGPSHTEADVTLRGTAFELACWIWGRLPAERLVSVGDQQIADRFQEEVRT